MAQESPLSATGALTEAQYERLAAPHTPDGIVGHPNDAPPVVLSGGQVRVVAGLSGLLRGFPWGSGDADTVYTPSLAGAARTDLVVLRLYRDQGYKVETAIRTGTPGQGAPAPATGTGPTDWYEIPIAEYDVANGAFGALRRRCWYVGDDGQILCKADTRPPHNPGRRIREVDTNRSYESNGSSWIILLDDTGWVNLSPLSGWSTSPTGKVRVRRINRISYLTLDLFRTGPSISSGVFAVATLPVGFPPEENVLAVGTVNTYGGTCRFGILANRSINIEYYSPIATGRAISIQTSWPAA
ncbi:hypothetical protein [Micromonospora sp. NPDC023956]|uniref:hypothetical protein n=1 Tax=Micromonospora sp. NPDC023956 TaxID=3155722 RepID=UPI0033CFFB2A